METHLVKINNPMVRLKPRHKAGINNMRVEATSPTNPKKGALASSIEICTPSKDASTVDKQIHECMDTDGTLIGL